MANKKAVIVGMGMDGSHLFELLINKGYAIYTVTRDNIEHLTEIIEQVEPGEIYNFSGISTVQNPFQKLDEIFNTNAGIPQRILEAIVKDDKNIKFFQASSALIFGRDNSRYQSETTPFNPIYPYGCAKLYAHVMVSEFRKAYGIFACCGIFFPHESERRKEHFFSRKITKAAATRTKITVGDLSGYRDYGYAPDYVEAAYLMLQHHTPTDYCIGTGEMISLKYFAKKAFDYVGLDYRDYVKIDVSKTRTNEAEILCANITKIKEELGWQPTTTMDEMIKKMVDYDRTI